MNTPKRPRGRTPAAQPSVRAQTRTPIGLAARVASVMIAGSAHAQQSSTSVDLPTVDVEAQTGGGYQATQSSIARLPVPLRDTPQTVNVVPKQVLEERSALTMEDALRSVPGITFSAGEGGQQGDGPIIRGFVARGDLFRDGMRDPGWYTRDLFNSDRVEVYKGPSAFAFGRGATGGAINTVTRLPLERESYGTATVTGTTGPGGRSEVDVGGKVNDTVAARIATLYQDIDTPTRNNIWTQRWGVAPSVSVKTTDGSKVTASYIYQGEQGPSDYGLTYLPQPTYNTKTGQLTSYGYYGNGAPTTPLPVSRDVWYGIASGPYRDMTETTTHIGTLKFEHEFSNDLKVTSAARYVQNDRSALVTAPRSLGDSSNNVFPTTIPAGPGISTPVDQMTIGRERRWRETDNTYAVHQNDLLWKFDTGGIRHTLTAGTELSRETRAQDRLDYCPSTGAGACRTSAAFPDPNGTAIGPLVNFATVNTQATNAAIYVSDQAKLNQYFDLLGSVRFDRFNTAYSDPNQAVAANRSLTRTDNMFSYRFGGVFHPTAASSLYVAYGNAYNPSAEQGTLTNASVAALAPERTKTIEAGAKVDVLDGKLSLTSAVFRIEKTNLRVTDPNFTDGTTVLDGIARVDGVEVGAAGKITDRWNVLLGYSYLQSRIIGTPDKSQDGHELSNTPNHNFTVWTTYDLTEKWTIGGGAVFQSDGWANNQNTAYVPAYWKFDAMVSYKVTDKSLVQLNIYNITDKYYYAQYFGANVVPAPGRWASLSYRIQW